MGSHYREEEDVSFSQVRQANKQLQQHLWVLPWQELAEAC